MMKKIFLSFILLALVGVVVYAGDAPKGDDDFLSNTLSNVFDKVHQYTTGEKRILSDDAEGMGRQGMELGGGPLCDQGDRAGPICDPTEKLRTPRNELSAEEPKGDKLY